VLLLSSNVRSYPHPHRLLARRVVTVGQYRFFLWSKISAEGLLKEDLLHPLPDLSFVHSGSIAPPSCVCKLSGLALDHMRGPEPLHREGVCKDLSPPATTPRRSGR
jgi:hypothetical protein